MLDIILGAAFAGLIALMVKCFGEVAESYNEMKQEDLEMGW